MGIVESVGRYLGRKIEDDEDRQNPNMPANGGSSGLLPQFWSFHSSLYGAIKGLLQNFLFIFYRKASADQILPIQNPLTVPISRQTTLSKDDASAGDDDQELVRSGEVLYVVSSDQQWPSETANPDTGKETDDHVIISIPSFTDYSCAQTRTGDQNNEIIDLSAGKGEDETPVIVKRTVVVDEERRIKHYSSRHRILLVGEGDFSFSASLAVAFGSASNIIATSLNSKAFLKKNYASATSNIEEIRSRGGTVMHGIDATEMENHESIRHLKFDRIVFNFPFAGFFPKLSPECQLRCHRRLVSLFLKNAKEMVVSEDGEIHITHKTNGTHAEWKVESIASSHGLKLIQAVKFKHLQYPGYNPKYGFGGDGFIEDL